MKNRRSEPRFLANQPVAVALLDSGIKETVEGKIVDFSASGIALYLAVPAMTGCLVDVRWPKGRIIAEVRNCKRIASKKFRIGLKIRQLSSISEIASQSGAA